MGEHYPGGVNEIIRLFICGRGRQESQGQGQTDDRNREETDGERKRKRGHKVLSAADFEGRRRSHEQRNGGHF